VANSTDVRQWLRDRGTPAGSRGQLPPEGIDAYNAVHPDEPYSPPQRRKAPAAPPAAGLPDENAGVSEADFPPAPGPAGEGDGGQDEPVTTGERPPRTVKPPRSGAGRFTRMFQRPPAGKRRSRTARQDLSNWAQDTWADLAWIAAPLPPVAMMLTLQAPYAGAVVDGAVKGTILDPVAQLAARYDGAFRALDGLIGPPLFTVAICLSGKQDAETGEPDNRTRGLFMGLRYSLMQMIRTTGMNEAQVQARAEEMTARDRAVDTIMAQLFPGLFGNPAPDTAASQPGPASDRGPVVTGVLIPAAAFRYPETQAGQGSDIMDGAGADPGRS
jgi:hypothetical protein